MARKVLAGEIVVEDKTGAGTKSAQKNIEGVGKAAEKTNKEIAQGSEKGRKSALELAGALSVANAAYGVVAGAIGSVIEQQRENIALADTQTLAENSLANALHNTAQFSNEAQQALQSQASAIQNVTTFGDEFLLQQQSMLVAMGANVDEISELTMAALDLSKGIGVDAKSAFKLLGQAVAGNGAALSRYSREAADAFKETGEVSAAVKVLRSQFGGLAEAEAKTLTGRLTQISNAYGDMREEQGKVLTQNPQLLRAMGGVVDIIGVLTQRAIANRDAMSALVSKGVVLLLRAFKNVIRIGGFLVNTFNGIKAAWQAVQELIVAGALGIVAGLQLVLQGYIELANLFLSEGEKLTNPLDSTTQSLITMSEAAKDTFADTTEGMLRTRDATRSAASAIDDLIVEVKNAEAPTREFANALGAPGVDSITGASKEAEKSVTSLTRSTSLLMREIEAAGDVFENADLALGEFTASGALAAQSLRESFFKSAFDVAGIINSLVQGITQSIIGLVQFNKDAALEFARDQQLAAESATLSAEQASRRRLEAQQAVVEARKKGEASALKAAQQSLQQAVIAEKQAQIARTKAARAAGDARADAEERTGKRVLRSIGSVLLQLVQQVAAAAVSQIIAALVTAEANQIAAASQLGLAGIAVGLIGAAAVAGAIAPLLGKAKALKAADGGVVQSGSRRGRDDVVALLGRDEAVLNARQQQLAFGGMLPTQGTTPGGMGRIPDAALRGGRGVKIGTLVVNIKEPMQNARDVARRLMPELRALEASGA